MKKNDNRINYLNHKHSPKHISLAFCLCILIASSLYAKEYDAEKKVKILPVPAFGFSPETKTYLGAVTLFTLDLYNDLLTRESNAKLELNYTWNKQLIIETEWNYFFKEESWFSKGKLHFSDYPDLYYGVGNQTPGSNELSFESKRIIVELSVLKNLGQKWFLGPTTKLVDYSKVEAKADQPNYPELKDDSTFGLGITLLHDSRNSILTPSSGIYFLTGFMRDFSTVDYSEITLDFRFYRSWRRKYVWANRLLNDLTTSTPPFFDYTMLGGDKYVRGYYLGRYREKNLSTWQTEFRFPVYKRIHMAAFGGLASLYSKENAFKVDKIKTNYGLGIRYLIDRESNTFLRMDYAIGQDKNDGFYISFGESF